MQPGRAITKTISLFAAHTQQLIKRQQFAEVKRCFSMAGVLYHNGSAMLKTTIESVFLYGISPLLDAYHLKKMLPAQLQQLRYRCIQSIY